MFSYIPPNGTSKYGMYFQRTKTKIVLKNKTLLVISSDNQKKKKKKKHEISYPKYPNLLKYCGIALFKTFQQTGQNTKF